MAVLLDHIPFMEQIRPVYKPEKDERDRRWMVDKSTTVLLLD
jgi:hypothetical protein